jgi:hypothetical protein
VVVAWFCGSGATFDISEDTWQRMPEAPGEIFGMPVSAGTVVLFPDGPEVAGEESPVLWGLQPLAVEEPKVRQVAVALVEVEAVADEELVRHREPDVAHW